MASNVNYQAIYDCFREKHARASDQILGAYRLSRWQPVYWLRAGKFKTWYNFKKCVKKLEAWQGTIPGRQIKPKDVKKQCAWWLSENYLTFVKHLAWKSLEKHYESTELPGFGD